MTEERRDRAYFTQDEVEQTNYLTDTELYEGEIGAEERELQGLAELELRDGETANPDVAAEEGLSWVPPIDPPVIADESSSGGVEVAAGFGTDAESGSLSAFDDLDERIREALRADSSTSRYADELVIGNRGGVVVVRGVVDDIDDTDDISEVIGNVPGVTEVRDETEVRGVTD